MPTPALRRVLFRTPEGEVTWPKIKQLLEALMRDEFYKSDYRDETSHQAIDSHFLNPINIANRNSVQSVDDVLEATSEGPGPDEAAITINAHSVKYDFDTVAYNSGVITDLLHDTNYIVYASDPGFQGGALAYSATTDPDNLIGKNVYYVGNVTTPSAGGGAVTSGGGAGAGIGGSRYDYR